jgi:hypothetical protein
MKAKPAGAPAGTERASMSADAPKTISPAARKFAEYLARRMGPMIQHAATRAMGHAPESAEAERHEEQ